MLTQHQPAAEETTATGQRRAAETFGEGAVVFRSVFQAELNRENETLTSLPE